MKRFIFAVFGLAGASAMLVAQAPARPAAAAARPQVEANLAQLMKGILFPNSNVIFFAQSDDPAKVPPAKDPALATGSSDGFLRKMGSCREQLPGARRSRQPALASRP